MRDSALQQVKSGLRWGGGLAAFLGAMLPLIDGMRRTVWASRSGQPIEWVGWIELIAAATVFARKHMGVLSPWVHDIRRVQGVCSRGNRRYQRLITNIRTGAVHFANDFTTSEYCFETHDNR